MQMNEPIMPDSVRDYMTNAAVRAAVDHLLQLKASALPGEVVEWPEVRNYHRAYLSAAQIRAEYAIYLMDVWQNVWAPAIKAFQPTAYLLTPKEQNDLGYEPQSPQAVWDEGHCRTLTTSSLPTMVVATSVALEPDGIALWFGCWDRTDRTEVSDQLSLPSSDWLPLPSDGWRKSVKSMGVDLGRVRAAAHSAMKALAQEAPLP